jgi:hypothetical protein
MPGLRGPGVRRYRCPLRLSQRVFTWVEAHPPEASGG